MCVKAKTRSFLCVQNVLMAAGKKHTYFGGGAHEIWCGAGGKHLDFLIGDQLTHRAQFI